jgi:hypothetical protein
MPTTYARSSLTPEAMTWNSYEAQQWVTDAGATRPTLVIGIS